MPRRHSLAIGAYTNGHAAHRPWSCRVVDGGWVSTQPDSASRRRPLPALLQPTPPREGASRCPPPLRPCYRRRHHRRRPQKPHRRPNSAVARRGQAGLVVEGAAGHRHPCDTCHAYRRSFRWARPSGNRFRWAPQAPQGIHACRSSAPCARRVRAYRSLPEGASGGHHASRPPSRGAWEAASVAAWGPPFGRCTLGLGAYPPPALAAPRGTSRAPQPYRRHPGRDRAGRGSHARRAEGSRCQGRPCGVRRGACRGLPASRPGGVRAVRRASGASSRPRALLARVALQGLHARHSRACHGASCAPGACLAYRVRWACGGPGASGGAVVGGARLPYRGGGWAAITWPATPSSRPSPPGPPRQPPRRPRRCQVARRGTRTARRASARRWGTRTRRPRPPSARPSWWPR
mmetsp:Transcript_5947/g.13831  ORF Transcript_5947/g.13831 Transcript_5947/m.13831 type:complete len:405 (-) Transcript_5947:1124-2338(-)